MLLLLAPGCDRSAANGITTRAEMPAASADKPAAGIARGSLLVSAAAMEVAEEAFREKLGASIVALELTIFANRVVLQAQDPKRPERVLQYEYRSGRVYGPIPVELQGPGQLADNLFPLGEAAIDSVPSLVESAIDKIDAAHGDVRYVSLRRNLPVAMDLRFRVFVTSPERDAQVYADANGKIVDPS
jgi:hypothetical protein